MPRVRPVPSTPKTDKSVHRYSGEIMQNLCHFGKDKREMNNVNAALKRGAKPIRTRRVASKSDTGRQGRPGFRSAPRKFHINKVIAPSVTRIATQTSHSTAVIFPVGITVLHGFPERFIQDSCHSLTKGRSRARRPAICCAWISPSCNCRCGLRGERRRDSPPTRRCATGNGRSHRSCPAATRR